MWQGQRQHAAREVSAVCALHGECVTGSVITPRQVGKLTAVAAGSTNPTSAELTNVGVAGIQVHHRLPLGQAVSSPHLATPPLCATPRLCAAAALMQPAKRNMVRANKAAPDHFGARPLGCCLAIYETAPCTWPRHTSAETVDGCSSGLL